MTHEPTEPQLTDEEIEALEHQEIQALLPEAAHFFGIGDIQKIENTPFGIGNESYFIITNSGEYVLRVLWEQTVEGLAKEIAIEEQLAAAGVVTAQLLPGETGDHYFTDGKYTITASARIPGEHPYSDRPDFRHKIGALMARFHGAVTHVPNPEKQWLNPSNAARHIQKVSDEHAQARIAENVHAGVAIFAQDLPSGFIHGDMYGGNIIVTPEEEMAILDFETTEHNLFIVDIARTILDMCADDMAISSHMVDDFLQGYESVRPLTDDEKANLGNAILYVSGAMAAWLLAEREQTEIANEVLTRAGSFENS